MLYFAIKAALSGTGALIASLLPISVTGIIGLWRDTANSLRMSEHTQATFPYVLPSLLMSLLNPMPFKRVALFWPALALGIVLTLAFYLASAWCAGGSGTKM